MPLEEVVLAQASQLEALMCVLERQGVVWKTEVLEELKRLKAKTVQAKSGDTVDAQTDARNRRPAGTRASAEED